MMEHVDRRHVCSSMSCMPGTCPKLQQHADIWHGVEELMTGQALQRYKVGVVKQHAALPCCLQAGMELQPFKSGIHGHMLHSHPLHSGSAEH